MDAFKEFLKPELIWFLVGFAFFLLEFMLPGLVCAFFGVVAVALFSNYLAAYVIAGAIVPALYALTFFEERELRDRFGEEYAAYSRRVPKFVPRWSGN